VEVSHIRSSENIKKGKQQQTGNKKCILLESSKVHMLAKNGLLLFKKKNKERPIDEQLHKG
jgi:hypothetical protein